MDLLVLVLVLCVVGFVVYLLTSKVPMPPYWATAIQVLAGILVLFALLSRYGSQLPDLLP